MDSELMKLLALVGGSGSPASAASGATAPGASPPMPSTDSWAAGTSTVNANGATPGGFVDSMQQVFPGLKPKEDGKPGDGVAALQGGIKQAMSPFGPSSQGPKAAGPGAQAPAGPGSNTQTGQLGAKGVANLNAMAQPRQTPTAGGSMLPGGSPQGLAPGQAEAAPRPGPSGQARGAANAMQQAQMRKRAGGGFMSPFGAA